MPRMGKIDLVSRGGEETGIVGLAMLASYASNISTKSNYCEKLMKRCSGHLSP